MLYCNDVITLIKYDGEGYTVSTLSGVSWYDRTQVKTENAGLVYANSVKVRIPAAVLKDGAPLPEVGDHIVHGALRTVQRSNVLPICTAARPQGDGCADNRPRRHPSVAVVGQ